MKNNYNYGLGMDNPIINGENIYMGEFRLSHPSGRSD